MLPEVIFVLQLELQLVLYKTPVTAPRLMIYKALLLMS